MDDYERRLITDTLKRNDCNVARASEALGLGSRQTLYKKIKRLAIDITDFLQEDTEPGLQFRAERQLVYDVISESRRAFESNLECFFFCRAIVAVEGYIRSRLM